MHITIIDSPYCLLHDVGPEHPECPDRLYQIQDQFLSSGLEYVLQSKDAKPATKQQLSLAHTTQHVEHMFSVAPQNCSTSLRLDDDTILMRHTLKAALHAAGSAIDGVELVLEKDHHATFCSVRPPGHHASKNKASGFCVFNNIAVAAYYALEQPQINKVAIVDFDVHHGNGTQDIVEGDNRILFCSSFQHPLYPYSGDEPTADNVKNIPIPAGTKGTDYRKMVQSWFETLDTFKPDILFVSAGFDAHNEDHMGQLRLVESDYAWLAQQLKKVADTHAKGRMVIVLEGGYALSALARSVVAFLKGLQDT